MRGMLYALLICFVPVVIYRQWMLRKGRVLTKEQRLWIDVFVLYLWLVLLVNGVGSILDFLWAKMGKKALYLLGGRDIN